MEKFVFENLEVWTQAVDFADIVLSLSERVSGKKHFRLAEQLEAACTSISMNIAEGCGRNSVKERIPFLYYSRGSLNETITLITILRKRAWISNEEYAMLYGRASYISRMLYAYIHSQKQKLT
ncbi:MAG: four helix bundle protein [Bacteroidia bacterium]|nr:four helix bundle protein [Bacteroidia bacterium]